MPDYITRSVTTLVTESPKQIFNFQLVGLSYHCCYAKKPQPLGYTETNFPRITHTPAALKFVEKAALFRLQNRPSVSADLVYVSCVVPK